MTRRGTIDLFLLLMTLAVVPLPRLYAKRDGPPNVIVIVVDDLRWDDLANAGHPFVRTPHMDRIACEGARFRNAFCTTPLCSPARASRLTDVRKQMAQELARLQER